MWGAEQQAAFNYLKASLVSFPQVGTIQRHISWWLTPTPEMSQLVLFYTKFKVIQGNCGYAQSLGSVLELGV